MKRFFSALLGGKKQVRRQSARGQRFRPVFEALEQRQLLTCGISVEFDSYYEVPVLVFRGSNQGDYAGVGVDSFNRLVTRLYCGDEQQEKSFSYDLGGGFAPGYVFFDGLDGNDSFSNITSIPSLLQGGRGNDLLLGGSGPDQILGSWGGDKIKGYGGNDIISGGYGLPGEVETIFAGSGNDYVEVGGAAITFLYGGPGDDYLSGGDGDDTIKGQGDNDILLGKDGIDSLDGGAGQDDLSPGNDVWADFARGGPGADVFYHPSSGLGARIADLTVADRLVRGDLAYQAPNYATWEAAVRETYRTGKVEENLEYYALDSEDTSTASLTVGEIWSGQFWAADHDVSIVEEPDWQNLVLPVADFSEFYAQWNESLLASAADDPSWAESVAEEDADLAAINDMALLALLAEDAPSILDGDPPAESEELFEYAEALEIDPLFASEPEPLGNDLLESDISLLESMRDDESAMEEIPIEEIAWEEPAEEAFAEETYTYESYVNSWSTYYAPQSWAQFRW